MTYRALCCGVRVIGRVVWIALGVMNPEEYCPVCRKWTVFEAEGLEVVTRRKAA
jgi:hypothetical protein